MLIGGLDAGNNTIILSLEDSFGEEAIIIPTITTPYVDNSFGKNNKKATLLNNLDVEITLNYDRGKEGKKNLGRHFVGQLAPNVNNKIDLRNGAQKKLGDEDLMICMLTTLAYGAIKAQGKEEGSVTADYNIVTGLPYLQYKNDAEGFSKQLVGNHLVKFMGDYDITVEIRVSECVVECEGFRATQSILCDKDGLFIFKPEDMVGKYAVGVDIGEFTTELMVGRFDEIENANVKFEFVGRLCNGWNIGITEAKQSLIDSINKDFATEISRHTIDTNLKSKIAKGKINLANGEEFSYIDFYKQFLREVAESISDKIVNTLVNAGIKGNILRIGLMGGGPEIFDKAFGGYMKDYLSRDLSIKPENIQIPQNALTINADCYLKRAESRWSKE